MLRTFSKRSIVMMMLLSAVVLIQICNVMVPDGSLAEPALETRSFIHQKDLDFKSNNSSVKRTKSSPPAPATAAPSSSHRPLSPAEEIEAIAREIKAANEQQVIRNTNKFGPIDDSTFVIVIQVHTRLDYLKLLIRSLSKAKHIERALLIFSHDIYLSGINNAVQNITFARVMQIFYPFSMQLHPDWFPERRLSNLFSNSTVVRERKQQLKNHWWWKANFVFDRIPALANYDRVITFLEEDYYMTPDFLWVLKLMEAEMRENRCSGCDILVLGEQPINVVTWENRMSTVGFSSKVLVDAWTHNFGMAYNRTLWTRIKSCGWVFCNRNDYNWDGSLLHVSRQCFKKPMISLSPKVPRLFHTGRCGLHFKETVCSADTEVKEIEAGIAKHWKLMYPQNITLQVTHEGQFQPLVPGGDWEDPRDRKLCEAFFSMRL